MSVDYDRDVQGTVRGDGRMITIDMDVLNTHTTEKKFEEFLDWLEGMHDRLEDADLQCVLETFLQACGREGYEFS